MVCESFLLNNIRSFALGISPWNIFIMLDRMNSLNQWNKNIFWLIEKLITSPHIFFASESASLLTKSNKETNLFPTVNSIYCFFKYRSTKKYEKNMQNISSIHVHCDWDFPRSCWLRETNCLLCLCYAHILVLI